MPFQRDSFQCNAFQSWDVVPSLYISISAPTPFVSDGIRLLVSEQALSISLSAPSIKTGATSHASTFSISVSAPSALSYGFISTQRLRDMPRLRPLYLIEIGLRNNGPTLCLCTENILVGSEIYEDYISEVSGMGDELRRADSKAPNPEITLHFKNEPWRSYNYLIEAGVDYPFGGADCTIKELYIDDDGTLSTPLVLFKGVLDEPYDIDLISFKCNVSSPIYHKDKTFRQKMLETSSFPNAYEDVGSTIPIIYGSDIKIPALRTDWGARSTLKSEITSSQTSIELSDASRFLASGEVWIDDEKLTYTSKSGNTLLGVSRGQGGTSAKPHRRGATVWQDKSIYESVLAQHELHSVGAIYAEIDGELLRVDSGISAVFEGGFHKLKAQSQIKIDTIKETISTTNPTHGHGSTEQASSITQKVSETLPQRYITTTSYAVLSKSLTFGGLVFYVPYTIESVVYNVTVALTNCQASGNPRFKVVIGGQADIDVLTSDVTVGDQAHTLSFSIPKALLYADIELRYETGVGGGSMVIQSVTRTTNVKLKVTPQETAPNVQRTGDVIATRTVDRFHAVVSGYKDPDGNYGGVGSIIERPDLVIKHFLVRVLGYDLSEIDTTSFDLAGTRYQTNGYRFGFCLNKKIRPSEFIMQLASECRSTLKYIAGKWYLDVISDTSPTPKKKISYGELAGEHSKFAFSKTPIYDIANDLTAKFMRNYSRLGSESEWDSTARASDSASITKYGQYPKDIEFDFIRTQAMSDSVLAHILKQKKEPYLIVEFSVFWEHFDLSVGDTIEIVNPLYNGKKFFIEKTRRLDKARAEIRAVEWW